MARSPVRMPAGFQNVDYSQAAFTEGETNYNGARNSHPLWMYPAQDNNRLIDYDNDFHTYAAGDWTVVAGGAGSGVALSAGVGGILTVTTATSGTESIKGNASFNFTPATSSAAGLQTWFMAQVTLDATVANPDYAIGLTAGAASSFNSATDGVYFTKATGASVWSLVIKASSTATTIALPASTVPSNSQNVNLAFYFDGKATLYVYFNKVCIGTVGPNGTLGTDLSNLPVAATPLGITFLNSFHTATSALSIDYVMAASERTN